MVGLPQLLLGHKSPVIPIGVYWVSMPAEGPAKSQQDQDHVNSVFWLGGYCPSQVHPSRPHNLIRSTTLMFFIGWVMEYNENGHTYGKLVIVISSFITHNVPAHASHFMQSFLSKHLITQVTQPPYSPEFAPCDFWLFPKLKSSSKGKRFQTTDEIQENMTGQRMAITTKDSAECFEQWKRY